MLLPVTIPFKESQGESEANHWFWCRNHVGPNHLPGVLYIIVLVLSLITCRV